MDAEKEPAAVSLGAQASKTCTPTTRKMSRRPAETAEEVEALAAAAATEIMSDAEETGDCMEFDDNSNQVTEDKSCSRGRLTPVPPTEVSSPTPKTSPEGFEENSEKSLLQRREKDILADPFQDELGGNIFKLTEEETDILRPGGDL